MEEFSRMKKGGLSKLLDLVTGKERARRPSKVTSIGPDASHAPGTGTVDTEHEVVMWDKEGLGYEMTDRKGRPVRFYRREGGVTTFIEWFE